MLVLILSELNRLQEQIDSDEEPDRHSETIVAPSLGLPTPSLA